MGFREVFASLQEAFPQVDLRLLKAVAIEHASDADAAAEFVISEVLSLAKPRKDDIQVQGGSSGTKDSEASTLPGKTVSPAAVGSSKEAITSEVDDNKEENADHLSRLEHVIYDNFPVRTDDDTYSYNDLLVRFPGYTDEPNSIGKHVSLEELIGARKSDPEHYTGQIDTKSIVDNVVLLHHKLHTESVEDCPSNGVVLVDDFALNSASSVQVAQPFNAESEEEDDAYFSSSNAGSKLHLKEAFDNINVEKNLPSPHPGKDHDMDRNAVNKYKISSHEKSEELEANGLSTGEDAAQDLNALLPSGINTLDSSQSSDDNRNLISNMVGGCEQHVNEISADLLHLEAEMLSSHEDYQKATIAAQSSQYIGIEFLENFVDDAISSKDKLISSRDSVINMMADVTILEEKAQQATEEASDAGQELHNKVKELKKTLKHAKEQNEMTAGEVYGERAILATEARELQSRLINLSDQRNEALSMVEQIRKVLELRIVAAEAEIAASQSEKLEKEAVAQAALEEQELLMDSIVHESKRLHQEAEENSKLREFLMDRGRLVDSLQGEIAVICENVLALKERVESGAPLKKPSQSTASSLTSSLSLSSIRSKSSTDVEFPPAAAAESQIVTQPDDKAQPEDKICHDDRKEPSRYSSVLDPWELFEMI